MRLHRLGLTRRSRLLTSFRMWWRSSVTRRGAHDLARVTSLRPQTFGVPFTCYAVTLLRGPSAWTVGQRELLAAVVAQATRCPFCTVEHQAQALGEFERGVVEEILAGRRPAVISVRLAAAVDYVRKLAAEPLAVGPADGAALHAAGLSAAEIDDLVHLTAALAIASRVAEALGFEERRDQLLQ